MSENNLQDINAFVQKHKTAVIIGAVVIGVLALSDSGEQSAPPRQRSGPYPAQDPYANDPYANDPYAGGGGGGSDYDPYEEYKERERRKDEQHERFVDEVIREVQTCTKDDGTIVYDVPVTVDCESLN
ncbi:MAG: hypothetical protein AAGJ09_15135 [Pseudomonadota bacterium]